MRLTMAATNEEGLEISQGVLQAARLSTRTKRSSFKSPD